MFTAARFAAPPFRLPHNSHFVGGPAIPPAPPTPPPSVELLLYHATALINLNNILRNGFVPSENGRLGPGVYFGDSEDLPVHFARFRRKMVGDWVLIAAVCDVGHMLELSNGKTSKDWSQHGYNSCTTVYTRLEQTDLKEYCIADPARIRIISYRILRCPLPSCPLTLSDADGWGQERYRSTLQTLAGPRELYVFGRGASEVAFARFDLDTESWTRPVLPRLSFFTDEDGWGQPEYYSTLRIAKLDNQLFVFGRGAEEAFTCSLDTQTGEWTLHESFRGMTDADGWALSSRGRTIRFVSDGKAYLYLAGRTPGGIELHRYDVHACVWETLPGGGFMTDQEGWAEEAALDTMQMFVADSGVFVFGCAGSRLCLYKFSLETMEWIEYPPYAIEASELSGAEWPRMLSLSAVQASFTQGNSSFCVFVATRDHRCGIYKLNLASLEWTCLPCPRFLRKRKMFTSISCPRDVTLGGCGTDGQELLQLVIHTPNVIEVVGIDTRENMWTPVPQMIKNHSEDGRSSRGHWQGPAVRDESVAECHAHIINDHAYVFERSGSLGGRVFHLPVFFESLM